MDCWGQNALEARALNLLSERPKNSVHSKGVIFQNCGKYHYLRRVHLHQNSKHELYNIRISFCQVTGGINPQVLYLYTDHKVCER